MSVFSVGHFEFKGEVYTLASCLGGIEVFALKDVQLGKVTSKSSISN